MIRRKALCAVAALPMAAAAFAAGSAAPAMQGVPDPAQARIDYMLKCQGCHRPDGTGDSRTTPTMAGTVSHFLRVPGGREFVARVPGVSTVDLDDARLAQLVNWTLYRFDPAGLPAGFKPYTPAEIGRFRQAPLRTDASKVRAGLVAQLNLPPQPK